MNESIRNLVLFAGIVAAWLALSRWVLPRLGVST